MARDHDEQPRDVGLLIRRALLRTDRTPLRPLWRALHELLIRAVATYVRRVVPGATVYAAGGFGPGEPVFGVSDIDLAVVVRNGERSRLQERWRRVSERFPRLGRLLFLAPYEEAELAAAAAGSCVTHAGAVVLGKQPVFDLLELLVRPGLAGPTRTWRRVAGPERRPRPGRWTRADERIAAWLELQYWWRYAFAESVAPSGLEHPSLCLKLVAEPARVWLALAHRVYPRRRREVLELTRRRLPEEAPTLTAALELLRDLPRRPPARLAEFLPFLVRQSQRIGRELERHAEGETPVALAGAGGAEPPLVDFRALIAPRWTEEKLVLLPHDPADPGGLAKTIAAASDGRQPALRGEALLVLPNGKWPRAILRGVQCPVTDPVSFAVLAGDDTANFPGIPGWSAPDWARRAVAEHRAWLSIEGEPPKTFWAGRQPSNRVTGHEGFGRLFTAARAALFHQSLEQGRPLLALTPDEVARALGTPLAEEALAAYRAGDAGDQHLFDALARAVRRLPAYA
jgi:hypothetical protein